MIETLQVNGSSTAAYIFTIPANLTIQILVQNDRGLWYNSSLISAILGVITGAFLTLFTNILYSRHTEKKLLERYEFTLLTKIRDIIDSSRPGIKQEARDLSNEIPLNLNFFKLSSHELIAETLYKHLKGEDTSSERGKITKRIKDLKKMR